MKGILLEKIGEAAQAKKEFGKVLTFNKWMQENDRYYDYYEPALYNAYAQFKLGNKKMSNHILDQIKEHKKIEKESLGELLSIDDTNIKLDW